MFKRLFKDGAIYGLGTLLARGVNILLLPLYTRVLSPKDYGISEVITTLVLLMGLIPPLEISQGLTRFFPNAKTENEKTLYASTAVFYVGMICFFFVLVCMPVVDQLAHVFLDPGDGVFILLALATFLFSALYNLSVQLLRCKFLALKYSVVNVIFSLVSILTSIYTVVVLQIGIKGVLLGNLMGYLVGVILALVFARSSLDWKFSLAKLKEMLVFSAPLVPSAVGYFSTLYINRIMLKFMLTITDVGLYNVSYRIVSPINLIVSTFLSSVTPLVYENYESKNMPLEIARVFRVFFGAALTLMIALSIFAKEALFLLTTKDYYSAASIVPVLTLSAIFSGIYGFNYGLYIGKKTGLVAIINIVSGLINIGLNFILIPYLGLLGAAWATCLAIIINTTFSLWFSQKYYPIPFPIRKIGAALLWALAIMMFGSFLTEISWLGILIKVFLVVISVVVFCLIGLITYDEIKSFFARISLRFSESFLMK